MSKYLTSLGLFLAVVFLQGPVVVASNLLTPDTATRDFQAKPGDTLWITLQVEPRDVVVSGQFMERPLPFFPTGPPGTHVGLLGIDLDDPLGEAKARVEIRGEGTLQTRHYRVRIQAADFRVQELTLPRESVDLDEETLQRVLRERQQILHSMSGISEPRLWTGPFIVPVDGPVSGTFGSRRVINGQPRNPHSGDDISAPEGTPVLAPNHGRVALIGDLFFSGRSIVLDHGLGLFTMYFHLSSILVKEGDRVSKGRIIGRVGATGRATGPHLHWGSRLNGARINPFSLIQLPVPEP